MVEVGAVGSGGGGGVAAGGLDEAVCVVLPFLVPWQDTSTITEAEIRRVVLARMFITPNVMFTMKKRFLKFVIDLLMPGTASAERQDRSIRSPLLLNMVFVDFAVQGTLADPQFLCGILTFTFMFFQGFFDHVDLFILQR